MFNLPERMRRDLSPLVKDPMIREMLTLPEQGLQDSLDQMARQLRSRGASVQVIAAYQALAPLLWENAAVLAYRAQTGASDAVQALPDLGTVDEAMIAAQVDYRLNPRERLRLRKMLADRPGL